MTKQAMSLITLSVLLMCGSSQAKIDNNAASDALFVNTAAAQEGSCDGTPKTKPCAEKNPTTTRDLFTRGEPVWLDEIEECQWDEIEAYYAEVYDDEDYVIIIEDEEAAEEVLFANALSDEVVITEAENDTDDAVLDFDDEAAGTGDIEAKIAGADALSESELKAKQAMAAIAVKPIPREVHKPKPRKPKAESKPKSNVAKIKPKKRSSQKKAAAKIVKKKATAVDKSRSVQRAVTYTVRGKSYTTVADSTGFVQKGVASWYGKRFHGLKTASGEVYDMNAMTAAHKKLPLGTKIEVVNNENGKKVVVTVNDRGPFHGNRVLDLSKAAAKELGVVEQGTVDVTIRAL